MKVVEGGTYVASNGYIVGPMMIYCGTRFIREHGDGFTWAANGKCVSASNNPQGPWDLVCEADPNKLLEAML